MAAAGSRVVVLTYHSISSEPGPTSIPPEVFRDQMRVLADCGYRSMTVGDFVDWREGRAEGERRVLITFDDGFADFDAVAAPALSERGFSSLVFLPTGKLGGAEAWRGANHPARPLMSWPQVAALAKAGVEFGSHSVTHADLPTLPPAERREEIVRSGEELADRLGKPTRSFAAPYGHVNDAVLDDLARTYEVAFGVRLDRASRQDNPVDVPRIEMHYFRNPNHLRDLLEGRDLYFQSRRLLRNVKAAGMNLMSMGRA